MIEHICENCGKKFMAYASNHRKYCSKECAANKNWQNTKYAVTDRRIIIESGFISMNYQSIYYKDITNVNLKISVIDKMLKVGDIYFTTKTFSNLAFLDIEDAYTIYPKLQKIVLDMQTEPFTYQPKKIIML